MRKRWFLAVAVWAVALPARVDAQFFTDSFDTYVTGSNIAGQGGWETWDNNPAADTTVVATQAFNPPNSLFVAGPADIVHQFTGVTSGTWHARVMTYIPSTQEGETFFILMNTYVPGVHNNPDWSAQVVLCKANCLGSGIPGIGLQPRRRRGRRRRQHPRSSPTRGWSSGRRSTWTNNQYQLFYGGQLFETQQWTLTDPVRLQAIDLFSNGEHRELHGPGLGGHHRARQPADLLGELVGDPVRAGVVQ